MEGNAVRAKVAEIAALKSTFFILILQGSQRDVLFSFGVKDMTLVEIEFEMHLAMQPFLNHGLRFI